MVNTAMACELTKTNAEKRWPYHEYYIGKRDKEERKNGNMEQNFWSGPESLDYYKGPLLRDTMHGEGVYRWRHRGPDGIFVTYEGYFFNNRMHGYGVMSYPDGRVYTGLYHNNVRWGPGVESRANLQENVGLWHGTQLVRLIWKPLTPSITPDFVAVPNGKHFITPFRVMLSSETTIIGEVNSAIELLKQSGLDPVAATEKWTKLYPVHCTDLDSQLCYKEAFERDYYKKKMFTLEKNTALPEPIEPDTNINNEESIESFSDVGTFYAWNNNEMVIHMMKHCYKHERQRSKSGIELMEILNGPRHCYKPAAQHEINCRTVLMASYLGHITNVAQLINEYNVNPNIADIQGNAALLYATCGDQADLMHFLVEAGADVNSYNDACCTPLGVALMRLACANMDIAPNAMVQALLPSELPVFDPGQEKVSEWNIMRDVIVTPQNLLQKSPSKANKLALPTSPSKLRSMSLKDISKKKGEVAPQKSMELGHNESDESFSEETRLYNNILNEYYIRVNDIFLLPNPINIPYIFEVNDMSRLIDTIDDDKKSPDKLAKKTPSKVIKDTIKPSKDMMWKSSDKEVTSLDSLEKMRQERLSRMLLTILQLLTDGANPRLVRFPQPALFMASLCGSADLVRHLVNYGADVNEIYPHTFGYTVLDIVISGPLTFENLDLIRALLECGANAHRQLLYNGVTDPNSIGTYGPTLLHAVLAKKTDNDNEEDVRQQILELLLQYRCNPTIQFRGRSAIDVALSKGMEIFDTFIKSPRVNLNVIINDSNQTILVKMFLMSFSKTIPPTARLQTLTNLLLFGADPLIECYNKEETYKNLFVFAKNELDGIALPPKPAPPPGNKGEVKQKKSEKIKKDDKLAQKSVAKVGTSEVGDYKQALDLVIECARLLHIRWIQAKLMKDLIETVDRFKHRDWVMILKEIKNKKRTGLWLTAVRCLEIWDILKSTKKRKYNDDKILGHVLCIVHFYFTNANNILRRNQKHKMTMMEKEAIELEVNYFLREHKMATILSPEIVSWQRPYVTPETVKEGKKFDVCFECAMPMDEQKIVCSSCKLISFCSLDCMQINVDRVNCHPCSDYLQKKYFPIQDDSVTQDLQDCDK